MVSEKSITIYARYALTVFPHCDGARMFQKSQQTRHTKEIVFQNF